MRTYYVYGDYGYNSENELYSTNNLQEAKDYLREYTRWGDMGGYAVLEVAWFDECGEYMTEMTVHEADVDGWMPEDEEEEDWEYFSD